MAAIKIGARSDLPSTVELEIDRVQIEVGQGVVHQLHAFEQRGGAFEANVPRGCEIEVVGFSLRDVSHDCTVTHTPAFAAIEPWLEPTASQSEKLTTRSCGWPV